MSSCSTAGCTTGSNTAVGLWRRMYRPAQGQPDESEGSNPSSQSPTPSGVECSVGRPARPRVWEDVWESTTHSRMASVRWRNDGMTQQVPAVPSHAPAPAKARSSPRQAHTPHGWIHHLHGYHHDYALPQHNVNNPLRHRLHHTLQIPQEPHNAPRSGTTTP